MGRSLDAAAEDCGWRIAVQQAETQTAATSVYACSVAGLVKAEVAAAAPPKPKPVPEFLPLSNAPPPCNRAVDCALLSPPLNESKRVVASEE